MRLQFDPAQTKSSLLELLRPLFPSEGAITTTNAGQKKGKNSRLRFGRRELVLTPPDLQPSPRGLSRKPGTGQERVSYSSYLGGGTSQATHNGCRVEKALAAHTASCYYVYNKRDIVIGQTKWRRCQSPLSVYLLRPWGARSCRTFALDIELKSEICIRQTFLSARGVDTHVRWVRRRRRSVSIFEHFNKKFWARTCILSHKITMTMSSMFMSLTRLSFVLTAHDKP